MNAMIVRRADQEPFKQARILVVDDVHDHGMLIAARLRHMGHTVFVEDSGARAIRIAESVRFDLAFINYQMPGMDGFEVSLRLNALGLTFPIVITTSTPDAAAARSDGFGIAEIIRFPISHEALSRFLERRGRNSRPAIPNLGVL